MYQGLLLILTEGSVLAMYSLPILRIGKSIQLLLKAQGNDEIF